jgi:hypothetical protein
VDLKTLLPERALRAIGRPEPTRLRGLTDRDNLAATIAAFANSTGGWIVMGAELEPESGAVRDVPGMEAAAVRQALAEAVSRIDPPLDHLVSLEAMQSPATPTPLALLSVRQSPSPPHLVVPDGQVLVSAAAGIRPVRSRAELDALYQLGRAKSELADRQIDGLIEKLIQAHYAYYGVGFVACTQSPTAEPYLWAREQQERFLVEAGDFATGWNLMPELIKVRPGEIELKGDKEAHGYVRVTRGGCVAVGEVRRRPPGNTIGTSDDVVRRISGLIVLGCRILSNAPAATIVPRLFYEGLRNQKVVVNEQPYAESEPMELDTAQFPGNPGDPTEQVYIQKLTADILTRLLAGFKVQYEADALPFEA